MIRPTLPLLTQLQAWPESPVIALRFCVLELPGFELGVDSYFLIYRLIQWEELKRRSVHDLARGFLHHPC